MLTLKVTVWTLDTGWCAAFHGLTMALTNIRIPQYNLQLRYVIIHGACAISMVLVPFYFKSLPDV